MKEKKQVTRIAAYGLIVQDGKILLCRLSDQLPDCAGKWTLPGGGINFGEAPVAAMVREVHEETGFLVEPGPVADIDSIQIETEEALFHGIRIIYHTGEISGTQKNEIGGTTDKCAWFDFAAALNLSLVELAERGIELVNGEFCK